MEAKFRDVGKVSITPKGAWGLNASFEKLDCVTVFYTTNEDGSLNIGTYEGQVYGTYIAKKDVPAGIYYSDPEYWMMIGASKAIDDNTVKEIINNFNKEFIEPKLTSLNNIVKNIVTTNNQLSKSINILERFKSTATNDINTLVKDVQDVKDKLDYLKDNFIPPTGYEYVLKRLTTK